jgi:hypothetical protein
MSVCTKAKRQIALRILDIESSDDETRRD